jgi:hypothetical protein
MTETKRAALAAQQGAQVPQTDEWEIRADGKRVRKDRWQWGIRRIVALLWGNRHEFEVDEVVDAVRKLIPEPHEDGDAEGFVQWAASLSASPQAPAQRDRDAERDAHFAGLLERAQARVDASASQAEQEPVAWGVFGSRGFYEAMYDEESARHNCDLYNSPKNPAEWLKPFRAEPLYVAQTAEQRPTAKTLTDEQIDRIAENCVKAMPDGIQGFCKTWGWRQFARELLDICAGYEHESAATSALELIAAGKRPDGTWNRDREACRQLAVDALAKLQRVAPAEPTKVQGKSITELMGWKPLSELGGDKEQASPQAPAQQGALVPPVTDAMVAAYLTANDAYWREVDALPSDPTKPWRQGTPKEATRVSLEAALSASPQAPALEPMTDEQIEALRRKTFSTSNPYCPVDDKSMRKAIRAYEVARGIIKEQP